jgi:excisionase family DNA binding protein
MTSTSEQQTARRTIEIPEVATMLGIPRSTAYDLARRDALPVPVLRLGRRVMVSRAALEAVLAQGKATAC